MRDGIEQGVRSKPKRGSQQIRDGPGLTERVTHTEQIDMYKGATWWRR